jgi:hypothetical protein
VILTLRSIIQELTLSVSENPHTGTPSNSDNYHTEDIKAGFEILANFERFTRRTTSFAAPGGITGSAAIILSASSPPTANL